MDSTGMPVTYPTTTTVKFIEALKRHPIVYDTRLRYVKAKSKLDAWKDVANTMQLSVPECMRRWRYLRDRYCRERKVVHLLEIGHCRNATSNASTPSSRLWPYYHRMAFLDPHIKHRLFAKRVFDVRERYRQSMQNGVAMPLLESDSNDLQDSQEYNGSENGGNHDQGDDNDDVVEIYDEAVHLDIKQEPDQSPSSSADHSSQQEFAVDSSQEGHDHDDLINGQCPHEEAGSGGSSGVIVENAATAAVLNNNNNTPRDGLQLTLPWQLPDGCSPSRLRQELQSELMKVICSTQLTISDIIRGHHLQGPAEDENDLFGRTIAASLKTFSSTKQWQAKAGIIQLLMQLQSEA